MGKNKQKKTWWKQRTKMEKTCLVAISIVAIVFLCQIIKLIYTKVTVKEVCATHACVEAAADILQVIDASANPCDDFYRYACGTFLKNSFVNDAPSPFTLLRSKAKNQMISIIKDDVREEDVHSLKALKLIYQACMNKTAIDEEDGKGLLELLNKLGGWPILKGKQWRDADFNWMTSTYKAKRLGFEHNIFILLLSYEDLNGALPFIRPPVLSKTFKQAMKQEYVKYVTDISALLGASRYYDSAEIQKMAQFEEQMQMILEASRNKAEADGGGKPEPITFAELQNISPHVPWLDFINNITFPSFTFEEDDLVMFTAEEYVVQLLSLLTKTPKRTQANYFFWKIVQSNLDYLKQDVLDRKMNYTLLTRGLKEQDKEERYKICASYATQEIMPFAAEAAYARKYTTKAIREDVGEMIGYLRTELEIALKKADWMDDGTKREALDKLKNLKVHIGAPEEPLNGEEFDRILGYDKIDLNATSFVQLVMESKKRFKEYFYSTFSKNVTNGLKLMTWQSLVEVNAFYINEENCILLPAAMLQGIFYNPALPKYYNFGTLGSIIGHEMAHAFTKEGSWYKSNGTKALWWSNATSVAYHKKVSCLIDSYTKYKTTETVIKPNGTYALKENACDFVGTKISYKAYQKWLAINGEEPILPGTKSTPNQLFWTTTAFYRCHQKKSEEDILVAFDEHSVPSFRITAPLRNTDLFADDFGCPLGSYMNPIKKCTVL